MLLFEKICKGRWKKIIVIVIIIIIQTYLCRIAASVLRKKTAINAGPVKN